MDPDFGPRLRQLRKEKKLTLQEVADQIGCTKAYVWALEKRPGQRPTADRVQALAKALGVTMYELMGETPPPAITGTMSASEGADSAVINAYVALPAEKKQLFQDLLQVVLRDKPSERS